MTKFLEGKAAVVTGGTSGIGLKIVETFRREGADVLFTGRNAERAAEVTKSTGAQFLSVDATSSGHASKVVDAAMNAFGRMDVLVNNAGTLGVVGGVEDFTVEALEESISVHLRAPWLLMAKAVPAMRKGAGGSIVNMTSVAGHRIGASSLAYSVAKAGLIHLTRGAAAELGKDNIRVNSVSPGFVPTPIHTQHLGLEADRQGRVEAGLSRMFLSRQALQRTGTPGDIADAVVFLASDQSRFVSGTDIVIDGGMIWGQPAERWS